jgi:hypothetical protein
MRHTVLTIARAELLEHGSGAGKSFRLDVEAASLCIAVGAHSLAG